MSSSNRALVILACLTAFLSPGALAGDIEEFVCNWLEEDTVCSGNQALSDDYLKGLTAEVVVDVPGCDLNPGGQVQVRNNFDLLWVKVEMSANFANPTELASECGTGCAQAGTGCFCRARAVGQNIITVEPGLTRYTNCDFPTCFQCTTDCADGQDLGECPFGNVYCTVPSLVTFTLKGISCDAGVSWVVLNSSQVKTLPWTLVKSCS